MKTFKLWLEGLKMAHQKDDSGKPFQDEIEGTVEEIIDILDEEYSPHMKAVISILKPKEKQSKPFDDEPVGLNEYWWGWEISGTIQTIKAELKKYSKDYMCIITIFL